VIEDGPKVCARNCHPDRAGLAKSELMPLYLSSRVSPAEFTIHGAIRVPLSDPFEGARAASASRRIQRG